MRARAFLPTIALSSIALLALAGCNAATPYPNPGGPLPEAAVSANPYARGSDAYCRQYAAQSGRNAYEGRISRGEDSLATDLLERTRARQDARRIYEECRAGRRN